MADNPYTRMQSKFYEENAAAPAVWTPETDMVVGTFRQHNIWQDYDDFLFKGVRTGQGKVALDFGCGPGRNIVKFAGRFDRIDGVDIAANNLKNARLYIGQSGIHFTPQLFHSDGVGIDCIEGSDIYDVVLSTIAIQHIPVYDIRAGIFRGIHRVLKPGGTACIQMGFGPPPPGKVTAAYKENAWNAASTNSHHDVRIESTAELGEDMLFNIGFSYFDCDIRPTGPGDTHHSWIFFRCEK